MKFLYITSNENTPYFCKIGCGRPLLVPFKPPKLYRY